MNKMNLSKEDVQRQIDLILGKNNVRIKPDDKRDNTNTESTEVMARSSTESETEHQEEFSDDNTEIISDEVEDESSRDFTGRNTSTESNKSNKHVEYSSEIKAYLVLFEAKDVRNNKILDGRNMTRKEYLKYTKKLSKQEVLSHPLLYRMFRSEEQMEGNFHSWLDQFEE